MTPESMDELNGTELVQLAMLAFLHMDKEDKLPKLELYAQIILWFDAMTANILLPHQLMEEPETKQ